MILTETLLTASDRDLCRIFWVIIGGGGGGGGRWKQIPNTTKKNDLLCRVADPKLLISDPDPTFR